MLNEAQIVKSTNIVKVVNDPEWQIVRKSLIGNWINNYKYNVQILREYLDHNGWQNPWVVRRVLNVLTGSVHRTKKTINQPETDQLRKEVRITWRNLLGESYDPEDPKYKTGEI